MHAPHFWNPCYKTKMRERLRAVEWDFFSVFLQFLPVYQCCVELKLKDHYILLYILFVTFLFVCFVLFHVHFPTGCLHICLFSTGLPQLQLRVCVLPSREQHFSEVGPVSTHQELWPQFHLLHGRVCPQLLHQLTGNHSWLHGHHTVCGGILEKKKKKQKTFGWLWLDWHCGHFWNCRCIAPELKSLALGIQTLVTRTLGESFLVDL